MNLIMTVYGCLVLIATGIVALVIADTLGPLCLNCMDISEPTHCATVTQCDAHEQCYLERFLNSVGSIVYRQGCRANRQCQLETLVGKRDIYRKSGELLLCSHCCSGHICNSAGCGHAGYLYPRGPVCFNCQDQLKTDSCNKITLCEIDEVCNLHFTTNAVTHDKIYETKCMRSQECAADLANIRMIISQVGKRDDQDSLSSGGICLFQCCSTDVCNNGCQNNSQSHFSGSTPPETKLTTSPAFVTSIDHCLSNPCRMGTCSELGYTYKCTCERGFYGRDCEHDALHDASTEVSSTPGNAQISTTATPTTVIPVISGSMQNLTYLTTVQTQASTQTSLNTVHIPLTSSPSIPNVTTTITSTTVSTTSISRCLSNPCIHGSCHDAKDSFVCICGQAYEGTYCNITSVASVPSDCYDILHMSIGNVSGIYFVILWKSHQKMQVYCDMDTEGGGWTVFQSRFDGSVDFFRNFSQYEYGFGSLHTEFWLGLAYVQEMVTQNRTELRLDLTATDNSRTHEVFKNFRLGEKPGYNLYIELDGVHRQGLFYHNNRPFSTYDRDTSHHCAVLDHGGWYGSCAWANLNGEYALPGTVSQYNAGEGGMIYTD